jgi:hypothetical protein
MNRAEFYRRETTAADYLQARAPRELWAAVLKQAIADVTDGPSAYECKGLLPAEQQKFCRRVRVAAEEWIADTENEPRRFVWVCEQLGLNPCAVRNEIQQRRKK